MHFYITLQVAGEDDGIPELLSQTNVTVEDDEEDGIGNFFEQVTL